MIRINNEPLPEPQGLVLYYLPDPAGPSRLRLTISLNNLDAAQAQRILSATAAPCTLSLFDPRLGAQRAMQATVREGQLQVRHMEAGQPSRSDLLLTLEESA